MRKVSLRTLNLNIILLIIIALPLNGIDGLAYLGELSRDASAHLLLFFGMPMFLVSMFLWRKTFIPNNIYYFSFILFLLWILICSIVSWHTFDHVFKNRSGYEKFFVQYILAAFFIVPTTFYFYNTFKRYDIVFLLNKIRNAVFISFQVVSLYALFEILHIYGIDTFQPILEFVDPYIRRNETFSYAGLGRIRSLSPEPPFLTMYLIFATPWLLSYFLEPKNNLKGWFLTIILITIVHFSGSRSGLIIVSFEILLFVILSVPKRISLRKWINIQIILPFFVIFAVLFLYQNGEALFEKFSSISISYQSNLQVSSISRWGTQSAAIEIAKENPIFGVGLGQQGFYLPSYYPPWAVEGSYEIRNWKSNDPQQAWPPGFSMITRLFAETGLIGISLFIIANLLLLYRLIKVKYQVINKETHVFIVVTLTCLSGLLINYLQFDSFRLTSYWLIIAIAMVMVKKQNLN